LAAVPADSADRIVSDLQRAGALHSAIVGEITALHPGKIAVERRQSATRA